MSTRGPYVVWLEKTGRGDVALVGGKNASLGEMVAHPRRETDSRPARFRHDRRGLLALRRRQRRCGQRSPRLLADLAPARRRWPKPATRSARPSCAANGRTKSPTASPMPTASFAIGRARRIARRRGPLQRHRRGPARGELRRPAGDLPQHPRRAGAARRLPALLRLALHRPRHRYRRPRASTI